jgi:hypothetical protein
MWYDGDAGGTGIRGAIGLATSRDGIAWERWDDPATAPIGDPVLRPGACGPGTAGAVVQPQVWRGAAGERMLFAGLPASTADSRLYGASSRDGQTWTCAGEAPILEAADVPGSDGLHRIRGGTLGGRDVVFVESLAGRGSEIWLADVRGDR